MVRFFLLSLLALIAGLVIAVVLARDPGYLLIAYGNYTFETSLFALVVALMVLLVLIKLLVLLVWWLNPLNWYRNFRKPKHAE